MKIGATTMEVPIHNPMKKRTVSNQTTPRGMALNNAKKPYPKAMNNIIFFLPNASDRRPPVMAPMMLPMTVIDNIALCMLADKAYSFVKNGNYPRLDLFSLSIIKSLIDVTIDTHDMTL